MFWLYPPSHPAVDVELIAYLPGLILSLISALLLTLNPQMAVLFCILIISRTQSEDGTLAFTKKIRITFVAWSTSQRGSWRKKKSAMDIAVQDLISASDRARREIRRAQLNTTSKIGKVWKFLQNT